MLRPEHRARLPRVLTVSGSPREFSRAGILLGHVGQMLTAQGYAVDHLSLRDLPAEALLHRDREHPMIRESAARLAAADGVVIATPVYRAAYSGLLKTWLDVLPETGLASKIALPLATGGSLADALALDYALRPVLSAMDARHVVKGYLALEDADAQDSEHALSGVVEAFIAGLAGGKARAA